jgi:hypothetical protein
MNDLKDSIDITPVELKLRDGKEGAEASCRGSM